jgi:hydroxylamine reductase
MYCYQCEQTNKGIACTEMGICGKQPEVAALQDLLIYTLKGLSLVATEARKLGITLKEVNVFVCEATFSTLTNVNFDPERLQDFINQCVKYREELKKKIKDAGGPSQFSENAANLTPEKSTEGLIKQGEGVGLKSDPSIDPDILSLQHTVLFGIKGISAYAHHAHVLGKEDDTVFAFIQEALATTLRKDLSLDDWVKLTLKCGETNLRAMELLDAGNTEMYGHPVPTRVPLGTKKGKAILVSGHDLKDMDEILKQSEGKNIFVYTHGEMLSTHGYPGLKKYKHFYGQFGTAWQNQFREFAEFPGPIVMTTNCLQRPRDTYKDHIFTCGPVGWPDIPRISGHNFAPVIEKATAMPGFKEDTNGRAVTTGFGRNAVLGVADKVIEAVKSKDIRHFFLVAGCDGAKSGRNYYTEFVEKVPKDCVVLTLACGKYRFFDKDLGDIGSIPRLLDMGQCNDSYSAIQVALALSKAFNCSVNDLPLSLVLSWYEQKAVAILLTLLHLGIKDIRLGPTLPAFITPAILDTLVKQFNIKPINTPDEDLKAILR